jgi:uridine kinase
VSELNSGKRPRIIGLSGGSGSGKTTLAKRLTAAVGPGLVTVLGLDHYYLDLIDLPAAERDRRNFDHPDAFDVPLLERHLRQLVGGKPIERPTYDFATHTRRDAPVTIAPGPVVLVDGILALHWPELRRLYDLSIYVDVDDDVRILRRVRRDITERGRTIDSVSAQYLTSVKPMHDTYVEPQKLRADIIVSWMSMNDSAVGMLAGLVNNWASA